MEPRKRHKKGTIAPGNDQEKGSENRGFQMEDIGDKVGTMDKMNSDHDELLKDGNKKTNALSLIANAKQSASKLKSYVTTRRLRKRPASENTAVKSSQDNLVEFNRDDNGLGLADVHDDYTTSKKLHKQGTKLSDLEMISANNRTLIHYFAKLGHSKNSNEMIDLEFIEKLIFNGADINCADRYGQTILHEVSRAWHVDVAKFLIENGADVNKGDNYGRTPLHVAAAVDYADMVVVLIQHGADKEAVTMGENQTPLFYAAKTDAISSLKVLVNSGCLFKTVTDYKGRTPIHVAAELDRSETARLLLDLQSPVWLPDKTGVRAITWMINKMAPVAIDALNQFHMTDRPNRKQQFYLNFLIRDAETDPDGKTQTPLQCIIASHQQSLLMHRSMQKLIEVMWIKYGRFWALVNLGTNFLYILMWTVIGVTVEYDKRHIYNLPDDIWRIVLFVAAGTFTLYQVFEEVIEFKRSQNLHSDFEKRRKREIDQDLEFCHPRWPQEKVYLEQEMHYVEKVKPKYFKDMWNVFDWICYLMLGVCIVTHIADVAAHSESLARNHIRIMSVTIILLWLRLMKNARAFALLGPFIVMLGHMLKDCARFLFLYLEFYIPYLAAFWMIFGGTKKSEDDPNETVIVSGYQFPGQLFFSLFRLTLVDDYDYDGMHKIDSIMSDVLVGTWLMLSAILCLNLFIALLSETFTRVYDKAEANAVMQKAITILNIWEGMSRTRRKRFNDYITNYCSPLVEDYDDDLTESDDDNLKKVTIEIKEELDNFQEMFKLHFGDPRQPTMSSFNSLGGSSASMDRFQASMLELKESVRNVSNEQSRMSMKIHKEMKLIKSMLQMMIGDEAVAILDDASEDLSSAPGTRELTPVSKLRKKKKNRKTSLVLVQQTSDDGFSTKPSVQESQPMLDIEKVDFHPASFQDFTTGVDSLFTPSTSSLPQSIQGTDETNTSNV